ncbi:hypothetical protein [Natronomonas sp.]|uniref:hypothetical protein n=1 Tax=Natronomonas sp. TaxID=2184060 RepID=UPI002638B3C5|nr:hypothetical protein [Natronomonas sp.]
MNSSTRGHTGAIAACLFVLCLVPVGAPAAQPSTPIDGEPGDRPVTVTVTVSDEFGAIRTETATVPIRPTTVEEQGPRS